MTLYLQIDDPELRKFYNTVLETYDYSRGDSGFDLYLPNKYVIYPNQVQMIDFEVKAFCKKAPLLLYPRSSICKTNLLQTNSVGVIDHGYRGNIKVALRNVYNHNITRILVNFARINIMLIYLFAIFLIGYLANHYVVRAILCGISTFIVSRIYIQNDMIVKNLNFHTTEKMATQKLDKYQRICQLCLPTMEPFEKIIIVDKLPETIRGEGGFGSTGI